jgi:hypothetical protein
MLIPTLSAMIYVSHSQSVVLWNCKFIKRLPIHINIFVLFLLSQNFEFFSLSLFSHIHTDIETHARFKSEIKSLSMNSKHLLTSLLLLVYYIQYYNEVSLSFHQIYDYYDIMLKNYTRTAKFFFHFCNLRLFKMLLW